MSADLQRSLAMFRFNFWPKPLFAHIPGAGGMDNPSSFVPNPLTSPAALMVLASSSSSSENPDSSAPRLSLQPPHPSQHHHSFPGQGMDKDQLPPPPPFSSAGFAMYRPGDPFPTPLYSPLSLMRPGMPMLNPAAAAAAVRSAAAFRPHMGGPPPADAESSSYHSAFSPTKKVKTEDSIASSSDMHGHHGHSSNSSDHFRDREGSTERESRQDGHSPRELKEERPSSLSSAGCETVCSETLSDSGDGYERGTPDSDGRALRKQRKRVALDGQAACCPICGLTLRNGELEAHLMLEVDKLDKLYRSGKKFRDTTPQGRKSLSSPSGSKKGKDSPTPEQASRSRYDSFLRIRCNRQSRLSSRCRNKKKRPGEECGKETQCPICNERLTGLPEELNAHVEMCLKQKSDVMDEDEAVDVEGEYEEYEWAGQTRIRATTMLQGGFAASGFQTVNSKRMSDDDAELNVDGDDTDEYGKPQFGEKDVIPLSDGGNDLPENLSMTAPHSSSSYSSVTDTVNFDGASSSRISNQSCDSGNEIVAALKSKLRDLEDSKIEKQKCLICMEAYRTPLASIQCWHVHCQDCWLKTLGVKKLCPQCNMITSPSDLRRIYL